MTNPATPCLRCNGHAREPRRPTAAGNECAADRPAVAHEDAARGEVDAIGAGCVQKSPEREWDPNEIIFEPAGEHLGGALESVIGHRWEFEIHVSESPTFAKATAWQRAVESQKWQERSRRTPK